MIILKEISKRERALSLFGPVPKTRSEPARPTTERTGVRERDFKNNASSFYVDVFQSQVRSSPLVNSHFGVGTWHCHTSTRTRPTLTQTWNALLENLVDEFSRWERQWYFGFWSIDWFFLTTVSKWGKFWRCGLPEAPLQPDVIERKRKSYFGICECSTKSIRKWNVRSK